MTFSSESLAASVAAVRTFENEDLAATAATRLVELQRTLTSVRRQTDVLMAQVAAEVARRSDPAQGLTGMARGQGFPTPGRLISSLTGGNDAEAHRLVEVGELLTGRPLGAGTGHTHGTDDAGEAAPPAFTVLAEAVRTGALSMDAAALVKRGLHQVADIDADRAVRIEPAMVSRAQRLHLSQIRRMIAWFLAELGSADHDQRERYCREQRSVTIRDDSDGMVTVTARLDAATAAPVKTVLDAWVKDAFRRRRERGGAGGDSAAGASPYPDVVDDRTATQIRADALAALCAHALDCDSPTSGVKTTMIVRVNLTDLQQGLGLGEVDGINSPLSVGAIRRMAVNARIIPAVMGTRSVPLDLGRQHRLYTEYQRLALIERDGGCAWCHAPPSYCETHHIDWWSHGGRTDIDNAVLLCTSCHHRIHDHGWDIHVSNDKVYFTPPASIDPQRRPRIAGRHAWKLSA